MCFPRPARKAPPTRARRARRITWRARGRAMCGGPAAFAWPPAAPDASTRTPETRTRMAARQIVWRTGGHTSTRRRRRRSTGGEDALRALAVERAQAAGDLRELASEDADGHAERFRRRLAGDGLRRRAPAQHPHGTPESALARQEPLPLELAPDRLPGPSGRCLRRWRHACPLVARRPEATGRVGGIGTGRRHSARRPHAGC